jgi:hypothetical protein
MDSQRKASAIQTLETAIDWHETLEREFRTPILPNNLSPSEIEFKLEEIELQRERHEKWGIALRILVEKLKKTK